MECELEWDGMRGGMVWDEVEGDGMRWKEMERYGMNRNGME